MAAPISARSFSALTKFASAASKCRRAAFNGLSDIQPLLSMKATYGHGSGARASNRTASSGRSWNRLSCKFVWSVLASVLTARDPFGCTYPMTWILPRIEPAASRTAFCSFMYFARGRVLYSHIALSLLMGLVGCSLFHTGRDSRAVFAWSAL